MSWISKYENANPYDEERQVQYGSFWDYAEDQIQLCEDYEEWYELMIDSVYYKVKYHDGLEDFWKHRRNDDSELENETLGT